VVSFWMTLSDLERLTEIFNDTTCQTGHQGRKSCTNKCPLPIKHNSYMKLSCRRETARCFVSMNVLAKYSVIWIIVRSLCDSWAFCTNVDETLHAKLIVLMHRVFLSVSQRVVHLYRMQSVGYVTYVVRPIPTQQYDTSARLYVFTSL